MYLNVSNIPKSNISLHVPYAETNDNNDVSSTDYTHYLNLFIIVAVIVLIATVCVKVCNRWKKSIRADNLKQLYRPYSITKDDCSNITSVVVVSDNGDVSTYDKCVVRCETRNVNLQVMPNDIDTSMKKLDEENVKVMMEAESARVLTRYIHRRESQLSFSDCAKTRQLLRQVDEFSDAIELNDMHMAMITHAGEQEVNNNISKDYVLKNEEKRQLDDDTISDDVFTNSINVSDKWRHKHKTRSSSIGCILPSKRSSSSEISIRRRASETGEALRYSAEDEASITDDTPERIPLDCQERSRLVSPMTVSAQVHNNTHHTPVFDKLDESESCISLTKNKNNRRVRFRAFSEGAIRYYPASGDAIKYHPGRSRKNTTNDSDSDTLTNQITGYVQRSSWGKGLMRLRGFTRDSWDRHNVHTQRIKEDSSSSSVDSDIGSEIDEADVCPV